MACVYVIATLDGEHKYVGATKDAKARWSSHKWALRNGRHDSRALQDLWDERGPDALIFSVLQECSNDELLAAESEWISRINPSLNLRARGRERPASHREAIARAMRGNKNTRGHTLSAEHRAKISASMRRAG